MRAVDESFEHLLRRTARRVEITHDTKVAPQIFSSFRNWAAWCAALALRAMYVSDGF